MTDLTDIIATEREDYWRVVIECLYEFYGMSREESIHKAAWARGLIKDHTEEQLELYYHVEPLSIANDLARASLVFPDEWIDRYLEIRDGTSHVSHQTHADDAVRMGIAG